MVRNFTTTCSLNTLLTNVYMHRWLRNIMVVLELDQFIAT